MCRQYSKEHIVESDFWVYGLIRSQIYRYQVCRTEMKSP